MSLREFSQWLVSIHNGCAALGAVEVLVDTSTGIFYVKFPPIPGESIAKQTKNTQKHLPSLAPVFPEGSEMLAIGVVVKVTTPPYRRSTL